jgi:hypothetical protein
MIEFLCIRYGSKDETEKFQFEKNSNSLGNISKFLNDMLFLRQRPVDSILAKIEEKLYLIERMNENEYSKAKIEYHPYSDLFDQLEPQN